MKAIHVLIIAAAAGLLIGIPQLTTSQKTDSGDILGRPTVAVQLINSTTPTSLLKR